MHASKICTHVVALSFSIVLTHQAQHTLCCRKVAALAGGRSGPDSGLAGQQLDGGAADADMAGGAAAPGVRQVGLPNMQSKQ